MPILVLFEKDLIGLQEEKLDRAVEEASPHELRGPADNIRV